MIVVDTHIIVWDALKPEMLSKKAKKAISLANETDGIIFCDISLWEIAMLIHKGRLEVEVNYYIERPDAFGPEWMIGFSIAPVVENGLARLFQ